MPLTGAADQIWVAVEPEARQTTRHVGIPLVIVPGPHGTTELGSILRHRSYVLQSLDAKMADSFADSVWGGPH